MKKRITILSLCLALLLPSPAMAWNETGHQVVARIAWDNMKPRTRSAVIALLKAAPQDADLASLFPTDSRPLAIREREFFILASTWADIVRDESKPARRQKYHRSLSHFINFFWERPTPNGPPVDRTDLHPASENVVERLQHYQASISDLTREQSQRAVDLAWVLHLAGDIHQPLHCSARVTATEPQGDQGGNLFKLDGGNSLHGYWDGILNRTFRREANETETAFQTKIVNFITSRHPRSSFSTRLQPGEFEKWAKSGHETCKATVYPASLRRNQAPSQTYRQQTSRTAEPAIALAGYRLAAMLDKLFE